MERSEPEALPKSTTSLGIYNDLLLYIIGAPELGNPAIDNHTKPVREREKLGLGVGADLVGGEGVNVLEQGLAHLGAALEDAGELRGGQLQQHVEGLRLRPLAALHKSFPHFRVLPHLPGTSRAHTLSRASYPPHEQQT